MDIVNEIEDWKDFREFVINEFIIKYDNDDKIKASLMRDSLDKRSLENFGKFIVLDIYFIADNDVLNPYSHVGISKYDPVFYINQIEDNGFLHTLSKEDGSRINYKSGGLIYINGDSTLRKYKIRKLV